MQSSIAKALVKTNRRAFRTATQENQSRKIGMIQVLIPSQCRHSQAISAPHEPPRLGGGAGSLLPIWNSWLCCGR